jgi:hypothetical protein
MPQVASATASSNTQRFLNLIGRFRARRDVKKFLFIRGNSREFVSQKSVYTQINKRLHPTE